MTKRHSIPDRRSVGRSAVVPFQGGEGWKSRHGRRLTTNLDYESDVRDWCDQHGVELSITNGGHHWTFTRGNLRVEWWPSSAKLVMDKQWRRGVHVHDWTQVAKIIQQEIERRNPK